MEGPGPAGLPAGIAPSGKSHAGAPTTVAKSRTRMQGGSCRQSLLQIS